MRDGTYETRVTALGATSLCKVEIRNNSAVGAVGTTSLYGHFTISPPHCIASLTFATKPGGWTVRPLLTELSLRASGTSTETEFAVSGLGPADMVIEIEGLWSSPLDRLH